MIRKINVVFAFVLLYACTKNPKPPVGVGTKVTVVTSSVSNITSGTLQSGGVVSSSSEISVSERGLCWGESINPTITNNSRLQVGSGNGSFSGTISNLSPNRPYYIRAYAINTAGVFYGNNVTVSTLATFASINTQSVSSVQTTSAKSGGIITADGGLPVTARGVVWSTSPNPTIALPTKTSDGSGVGQFISTLTGLLPGTTYYVRAYATNTLGTSYGASQFVFSTLGLAQPALNLPASNSTINCCNVNFSWSSVSGAASYELQVSRSGTFSGIVYTILVCGGTSYPNLNDNNSAVTSSPSFCMSQGPSTAYNGLWYWRVRAINGSNSSGWSAARAYTYIY